MDDVVRTADGSFTLESLRYGETYHSTFGALTEARHVFLNATGVNDRLRCGLPTRILEIGFGLGLNALLSADVARQHGTHLFYHAFEHDLVIPETFEALGYATLVEDTAVFDSLVGCVTGIFENNSEATRIQGSHQCTLAENIHLVLHLEDASKADFQQFEKSPFHAIYLDAFSPDTNAECWDVTFIKSLANLLASDGALSTYSAKGAVRRAMSAAGLTVKKLPGPPGKREMLVGYR